MSQRVSCQWQPDSNAEASGKAGAVQTFLSLRNRPTRRCALLRGADIRPFRWGSAQLCSRF